MKKVFTAQDVIDMGVELYEKCNFTRAQIRAWLEILVNNGCANVDIESVYDLIVGQQRGAFKLLFFLSKNILFM